MSSCAAWDAFNALGKVPTGQDPRHVIACSMSGRLLYSKLHQTPQPKRQPRKLRPASSL